MSISPLPWWIAGILGGGGIFLLHWLEVRRPLRLPVEPKLRRAARNVAIAGLSAVVVVMAESPLVQPLAVWGQQRGWGLVHLVSLPPWLEVTAALVLMDYAFYVWHVLMHRVPFLWRMHLVHHVDLDLDASTALRFHFTEMLASIPWRAGEVVLIGLTPFSFSLWQCMFLLSILFHHSNIELPISWERRLNRFIVTPRMHGIHHSIVERETNANWSSGLTVWDWLHGTLRLNVPQMEITIGVPAFQETATVTLPRIVAMPFQNQPPSWEFRSGGSPEPHSSGSAQSLLLP